MLKKYIPLLIAIILGAVLTYLVMSLNTARQELKKVNAKQEVSQNQAPSPSNQEPKDEKYWLDERIEKQSEETEKRIEEQQSQGDELKNQFEKFAE